MYTVKNHAFAILIRLQSKKCLVLHLMWYKRLKALL
nr:MAG TPA: hypothetical protein [Caudoviricetes sp.]